MIRDLKEREKIFSNRFGLEYWEKSGLLYECKSNEEKQHLATVLENTRLGIVLNHDSDKDAFNYLLPIVARMYKRLKWKDSTTHCAFMRNDRPATITSLKTNVCIDTSLEGVIYYNRVDGEIETMLTVAEGLCDIFDKYKKRFDCPVVIIGHSLNFKERDGEILKDFEFRFAVMKESDWSK